MACSPAPSEYSLYEPPIALWELVEKHVSPHERQEIRKMLGESLVDQSLELHEEVNTLLEIWRDYREETEALFTKNRLPEPPAARERLKQEIKFFVESIREKAKDKGGDAEEILCKHKTEVIDYALDTERAPSSGYYSRPSSARSSRDGRDTPLMRGTPLPDRDSNVCSRQEEVEAINDKLTYLKFDEVIQHLRETLEDEVSQLTRDTEFLQNCLDDEADFRCLTGPNREPTLTELREERSHLEKDLLSSVPDIPKILQGPKKTSPPFKPMQSKLVLGSNRLKTLSSNTTTISSDTKPRPLKASHQISPEAHLKPNTRNKSIDSKGTITTKDQMYANMELPDTQPQHIVVRTNKKVTSVLQPKSDSQGLRPSPPTSAKPSSAGRPGSAQKFRRMIMDCRD